MENEDSLYDDIVGDFQDKKALPERFLKLKIYNAIDQIEEAREKLEQHQLQMGAVTRQDIIHFRIKIMTLFGWIKYMVLGKIREKNNPDMKGDLMIFHWMELCEYGKEYGYRDLIAFKNLLYKYMDSMNLTNLLRSGLNDFKDFEQSY